jgi:hypothetical protein
MESIIRNLTHIVMEGYKKDRYWLTIRVTIPTDRWDIPRWHCDGNYFWSAGERKNVSKFATTLQGSGTLLMETTHEQREKFIKLGRESFELNNNQLSEENRSHMSDNIEGIMIQPNNYQSVIFRSGDFNICGIHSEPKMHTYRMFLSIATGSKKEVDGWKNQRKVMKGGSTFLSDYSKIKHEYLKLKSL